MPWSEHHVHNHKLRTDRAIHRACSQLVADSPAFDRFQDLLICARKQAPRLFQAPVSEERHPGVEALVNLSRFRESHLRPVATWSGTSASWRPAIASLANHLMSDHHIPVFLASSWYASDRVADQKRGWYVAHSRGASFRSLDLPILMTRKMEHPFLASQDHLPIEHALRIAELRALGTPVSMVEAIMSTPLAADLCDSAFWRTVWLFLITNASQVDATQIGPLIDYIQAVREDRTQNDMAAFGSPRPVFSMKGRTVQSILRLMKEWHRSLGMGKASLSWAASRIDPLLLDEPSRDGSELPRRWHLTKLVNSAQLRREGAALHHCVASYADRCSRGVSSIWSLRFGQAERSRHVLTVEVDPRRRAIIQARGYANRTASGKPLLLLQEWAAREKLQLTA